MRLALYFEINNSVVDLFKDTEYLFLKSDYLISPPMNILIGFCKGD